MILAKQGLQTDGISVVSLEQHLACRASVSFCISCYYSVSGCAVGRMGAVVGVFLLWTFVHLLRTFIEKRE